MKEELEKLNGFLREALDNPETPIARADALAVVQTITMRPVNDGEFPDIECLEVVLARIMGDVKRISALKRTPFEPVVALLGFLSEKITQYKDWADQQKPAA